MISVFTFFSFFFSFLYLSFSVFISENFSFLFGICKANQNEWEFYEISVDSAWRKWDKICIYEQWFGFFGDFVVGLTMNSLLFYFISFFLHLNIEHLPYSIAVGAAITANNSYLKIKSSTNNASASIYCIHLFVILWNTFVQIIFFLPEKNKRITYQVISLSLSCLCFFLSFSNSEKQQKNNFIWFLHKLNVGRMHFSKKWCCWCSKNAFIFIVWPYSIFNRHFSDLKWAYNLATKIICDEILEFLPEQPEQNNLWKMKEFSFTYVHINVFFSKVNNFKKNTYTSTHLLQHFILFPESISHSLFSSFFVCQKLYDTWNWWKSKFKCHRFDDKFFVLNGIQRFTCQF